jgi:phosphatidylserine/phosphatidylglycerophosphate/cardiolipin synthase-like enzyme
MRRKARNGALSVHAIAGSHVVLLGIDMAEPKTSGLLGFAIKRIDHTEGERYWLQGFKTFEETDPGLPPGSLVSTLDHPVQAFLWSDFTAKPNHHYTYRVVAMTGKPKDLDQTESVEVDISTEDEAQGVHTVYFNRGVAGSQAYARKFGNRHPDQVSRGRAWTWLSRGLVEGLLRFIGQANGERFGLRAALYEAQYAPVLDALAAAATAGADVKIVFDARPNPLNYPNARNREAMTEAGLSHLAIPREANRSYIAHNKFIVLLEDGQPTGVWTGSTNITAGGIFGHSNVGHLVRDRAMAAQYLEYWTQLSRDAEARTLRIFNEGETPLPEGLPPSDTRHAIFSPRSSLQALQWYADRMDQARHSVFFTAAFGVNDLFERVLTADKPYLRYVLVERGGDDIELIRRDPDNRIAVGSLIGHTGLERWLREQTTGLNVHVRYVHTKYMLIDPLTDDPLVITGSANFSDASTKNNDENMLVIRGDRRVADIYLGEFMRLFNHFYFRAFVRDLEDAPPGLGHLRPNDSWRLPYYHPGSFRTKERVLFAG